MQQEIEIKLDVHLDLESDFLIGRLEGIVQHKMVLQ